MTSSYSILADISDEQIAGQAVEGIAPRIAQTGGPDFIAYRRVADERVACRYGIGRGAIHIQAQHGSQQGPAILAVAVLVPCAAAVAGANVQVAVRAKGKVAPVVIASRLGKGQKRGTAGGIRPVRIGAHREASDHSITLAVCVVHKKGPIVSIGRMKSQTQEALLVG